MQCAWHECIVVFSKMCSPLYVCECLCVQPLQEEGHIWMCVCECVGLPSCTGTMRYFCCCSGSMYRKMRLYETKLEHHLHMHMCLCTQHKFTYALLCAIRGLFEEVECECASVCANLCCAHSKSHWKVDVFNDFPNIFRVCLFVCVYVDYTPTACRNILRMRIHSHTTSILSVRFVCFCQTLSEWGRARVRIVRRKTVYHSHFDQMQLIYVPELARQLMAHVSKWVFV